MAKKNKKKAADKPAAAAPSTSSVETAFASGNYAAVKMLARSDQSETAHKLLDLTRIDKVQVAVGVFAMLVVLIVAFITLHA